MRLPKYDANDGHEIAYTLDEVKVNVTGIRVAETGFTVTNTVPVGLCSSDKEVDRKSEFIYGKPL